MNIKSLVNIFKNIKSDTILYIIAIAILSALAIGRDVIDEHTLMMIFLLVFTTYHRWVRAIIFLNLLVFLCYSIVGLNYGRINISMIDSVMNTNINESLEFFSTLSIQSIYLSILYAGAIVLFFKNTTINNQQSTINNQQSTINNQQSTINNQKDWYSYNFCSSIQRFLFLCIL